MNTKVETSRAVPNGFVSGSQPSPSSVCPSVITKKENKDCPGIDSALVGTGTPLEGNQLDAESCSSDSPFSVSEVLTEEFESLSSDPEGLQEEQDISDFTEIIKTGVDAPCAAIALESLLENLEFVPFEVNRLLKLIGLLDEKCEEITELLDRPNEEWFETRRRSKKQKKSTTSTFEEDDLSLDEDSTTNVHSTRALLVYRKIYEGQDDTGFDTYISKLKKARKLERQKQLDDRCMDLTSIEDSLQICYEKKSDDTKATLQGEQIQKTQDSTRVSQGSGVKGSELESAAESSQNTKTTSAKRERGESDLIDQYFSTLDIDYGQLQSERAWDELLESEGIDFDVRNMNDNWKEKLDDIRKENAQNHRSLDDMEDLDKWMEEKLSLLWRYTLRKKALTRKLYETALHQYATLVQELEPQKFSASLECYPEATIMQNMLLNDVEEEYLRPNEMLELYKDVGDMIDQFEEQELITNSNPQLPLIVKAEETTTANLSSTAEIDKNASINGALRTDKSTYGSCYARLGLPNGTMSTNAANGESFPSFERSDLHLPNGNSNVRRANNKRHKPTKPPVGMAHAAKSPQSTGRLLTYHDIATSVSSAKLSGHPAELFWPDDDLWYLIRINSIDLERKTAFIVYTTGETECLDLNDIVREGHMSLLPEAEDTDGSNDEECAPRQMTECEVNEDALSELSASEPGARYSNEASVDGEEAEDGTDDELEAIHHRRPPRSSEIKSARVEIRHKATMDSSMDLSETQDEKTKEKSSALVFPVAADGDQDTDSSDVSIDEDDGDVEEPLIVHTSKPSGSRSVEAIQQSSTPRLLLFDSDSEDSGNKDDLEMDTEALNEFIAQRTTTSDPESDHDTNKSELQEEDETDGESESSIEAAPGMECLTIDMETSRQRALREMAAYDRIGRKHFPAAETPFELIDRLQKRKDGFVHWAKMRREPFEKFQDFDSFIDEIMVTNDQSWKDVEVVNEEEEDDDDDMTESDD